MTSASEQDIDWFTNTRRLVPAGDLRALGVDDLRRYRTLAATLGQRLDSHSVSSIAVHHLPHAYSQFGSLPGLR